MNKSRFDSNNSREERIPKKWKRTHIHKVASVKTGPFGAQLHESDYVVEGTPIITVEHLGEFGVQHRNLPLVSDLDKARLSGYMLIKGDIVFSRVGSVDRCSLISEKEDGWLFSGRLLRVRPDTASVYPRYLSNCFNQHSFKCHMRSIAVGGTMACLNTKLLSKVSLVLPLLPEQKAIAEVLECWDRGIRSLESKIEKKRLIKKGLMQKLLSGQMRLPGFSGPWKTVRLSELGLTYSGLSGKTRDDFGSGAPFISYMNIYSNASIDIEAFEFVTVGEKETQNRVAYGDVLFTTSSETADEVGISSVLLEEVGDVYLNSFCFGFRLHNFDTLLPIFAVHYFRGSYFRRQMTIVAQGATRYNLSKSYFLQTELHLPSVAEQEVITKILTAVDSEIENLERKLALWKDQKKFLLNNLVTGTIRLPQFCKAARKGNYHE